MYMKQLSFFLFVATGLILCTSLSAQQYHDAAAFGLKGNVKECKVVDAKDGSERFDPLGFYSLSFSRDGKLTAWNDHKDNFFDVVRSGGLLTGIKQKEVLTEAVMEYRFRYRNGAVVGYYTLCNEVSSILGPRQETVVVDIWADKGDGIFYSDITSYYTISDELSSFIDDQFTRDNPKFYNDETYGGDCSSLDECRILKSDSYGNYVLLDKEDLWGNSLSYRLYGTSTTRLKRIITYWDDEPATAKTNQATEKPSADPAPKPAITEKPPGLRPATPKELIVKDLLTRPFGVLSKDSRGLSKEQIMFDLSDYGWKPVLLFEGSQLTMNETSGYDMSFLGRIPERAFAQFTKDNQLWCFTVIFEFDNMKEAERFANQLISSLNSEGIGVPDYNNHNNGHTRKFRYNNSFVYITMPDNMTSYRNKVTVHVSYRESDSWIE